MIGDSSDFMGRLRSLVARSWFPSVGLAILGLPGDTPITSTSGEVITSTIPGPPILAAVLTAPSTALAFIYSLLAYIRLQTRIATASGGWLDLVAYDFFGSTFVRAQGQSDSAFATAIVQQILLIRNTRHALTNVLTKLTSVAPTIFEPWRIPDCGALNSTLYYDASGLRGSRTYPFVVFVTVNLGSTSVSAAQIYAAIESVRPAGIKVWVQIPVGGDLDFSQPGNDLIAPIL